VKVWYQAGTAWWSIRQDRSRRVLVPELLVNDDDLIRVDTDRRRNLARVGEREVDISEVGERSGRVIASTSEFPIQDADSLRPIGVPANATKQVWLTVTAGPGTLPGRHSWEITATSARTKTQVTIPVVVNVLPFALDDPVLEYSIYYRGYLDMANRGSISSERKSPSQLSVELENLRTHGISNPTIYQPADSIGLFEKVLRERARVGIAAECIHYLGITTGNYGDAASLHTRLKNFERVRRLIETFGHECINVYGVDEAEPRDIVGQFPVWDQFNGAGAGIFTAAWQVGVAERQYAGRLKILVLGAEPRSTVNAFFQNAGTAVYLYNQPQVGVENPLIYRINYGFSAWREGFDGVMNYAYQDSMGFIWNDFDHAEFRDHVFAYPTVDGVVDTLAWEGFREAVDDVRYISTLQNFAKKTDSPEAVHAVEQVRSMRGFDPVRVRQYITQELLAACKRFKGDPRLATNCLM